MEERYLRNLGALTEAECEKLRGKKIFVAGCGGLGGHIIDMLLRIGVDEILCADGDVFEESNLNRQLLSSVSAIGRSKAEEAAAYAARVNPNVTFTAYPVFITAENADEMICGCDVVMDALDGIPARKLLKKACDGQGIPYIFGAISGWVAQCAVSAPGDGLMELLYPSETVKVSKSVLSFTPALCAAMQCALCVRLLTGRETETGKVHYFDLLDFEMETLF